MELNSKQQVLVAIYSEYLKDWPDMNNVMAESLDMDVDVFIVALNKLINEDLIRDVTFVYGGDYDLQDTQITPYGLKYVEEILNIQPTLSRSEKIKVVISKVTKFGYDELKDVAIKTLAEIIKG